MRVALVTDSFSTGGGLEHIYQICKGMPDIEFFVFGKPGEGMYKFKSLENTTICSDGYSKKYVLSVSPDIVHVHHIKPLMLLSNLRCKKIFTVHGIHIHKYEFINTVAAKLSFFLRSTLEKKLYKRMDAVIAVSNDDRDYLEKVYNVRSEVIHNGIDFEALKSSSKSKEEFREDLGLPTDRELYLTVARFEFPKAYDVLINSISILKSQGEIKNKKFVFVGGGHLLDAMKTLAKKLGVEEHIVFLGPRNDVYDLLRSADTFVLPSRWEGLPISMIEALACNLPVVASDTYGIRDVYQMDSSGGVHLFECSNSYDLARSLIDIGEAGRSNVDKVFSIKSMVDGLRNVYK